MRRKRDNMADYNEVQMMDGRSVFRTYTILSTNNNEFNSSLLNKVY